MTSPKLSVLKDTIPEGEENAIHMADLARRMGVSMRYLREMIAYLRCNGTLVASSVKGYFYPADVQELDRFLNEFSARTNVYVMMLGGFSKE